MPTEGEITPNQPGEGFARVEGEWWGAEEDQTPIQGKFLRYQAGLVFVLYALLAFILGIKLGFYGLKILVMVSCGLLLLSPPNYPFLLGLLIPVYYYLKSAVWATPEYSYTAHYAPVVVILMALGRWLWEGMRGQGGVGRKWDVGFVCLGGITVLLLLGATVVQNHYLYFSRMVDLLGFVCAYRLGRSYSNTASSTRLLLGGLALGILAFELPYSLGFVLREGVGVMGQLDKMRAELGAGTGVGSESGTMLVTFALAYSLASSFLPRGTRRLALWLVSIPAGVVIAIYLSRTAILLLPVAVVMNLVLARRRGAALAVALITLGLGAAAVVREPALLASFKERMYKIGGAAFTRQTIRMEGIGFGLSHPLLGIGAAQFPQYSRFYHAHNEEITVLAEQGMVAFFLYGVFWVYLGWTAVRMRLADDAFMRSLGGVFLVVLTVYFLYAQIQPIYTERGGMLFTFCAGLLVRAYQGYRGSGEAGAGVGEAEQLSGAGSGLLA